MAYFTPTVLPMIAVANIWLFFYTPRLRPARAGHALARPGQPQLARRQAHRAAAHDRRRGLEGGGLLHDLLPRRAAADPAVRSPRRPRSKARRAGSISAASLFPLLMPTTLFVLVNASSTRSALVDHIIVMTRGGPDNATHAAALLHLRGRLQLLGHRLRRGADRRAARHARLAGLGFSSACSTGACTTDDAVALHPGTSRRWRPSAPGCSACSGSCRCSTPCGPRSTRPNTPPTSTSARR